MKLNQKAIILRNSGLLNEELPPMYSHQEKAVQKSGLTDYALIIRGAGSGKTRIGIELVKRSVNKNSHIVWLCPAALIQQTMAEFESAELPVEKYESKDDNIRPGVVIFISYDLLKRNIDRFTSIVWDLAISDEFHRTRNEGTIVNEAAWSLRKKSKKFYALTATPFNNYNKDFFEIISIVVGEDIIRKLEKSITFSGKKNALIFSVQAFFMKTLFGKKMENKVKAKLTLNRKTILQIMDQFIDYVEPEEYNSSINRPKPESRVEFIELSEQEVHEYKSILKDIKIRNKEPILRAFLLSRDSSKIKRAVSQIKGIVSNKDRRVILFSNFVDSGLGSLSKNLEDAGIEHEVYKGSTDKKKREEIMDGFKKGTVNVLLISPSGFEGLNLKGTTDCIVLDPHYNPAKTEQIIARGLRAGSTVKKVNITHYCAVSKKLNRPTIDQKIMKLSNLKKERNTAMEDILRDKRKKELEGKK